MPVLLAMVLFQRKKVLASAQIALPILFVNKLLSIPALPPLLYMALPAGFGADTLLLKKLQRLIFGEALLLLIPAPKALSIPLALLLVKEQSLTIGEQVILCIPAPRAVEVPPAKLSVILQFKNLGDELKLITAPPSPVKLLVAFVIVKPSSTAVVSKPLL